MNALELSQMAKDYYEKHRYKHPEDKVYDNKYPCLFGILSSQAAQLIREAKHIKVVDSDSIELSGYTINVYENGTPSKVKGSVQLTHHQYKQLLRGMVVDWLDGEPPWDWSVVNLSDLED
jgi:hypothetical protein